MTKSPSLSSGRQPFCPHNGYEIYENCAVKSGGGKGGQGGNEGRTEANIYGEIYQCGNEAYGGKQSLSYKGKGDKAETSYTVNGNEEIYRKAEDTVKIKARAQRKDAICHVNEGKEGKGQRKGCLVK